MNICLVSNFRKNGYGESTRPHYLSLALKKQGHNVLHLCRYSGKENGVRYISINTETWEPSAIKRFFNLVFPYLSIRLFNPDVIYVHQFNNARWSLATKILPKRKMILDAHTTQYFEHKVMELGTPAELKKLKELESAVYNKMDYIICASDETKEVLLKGFGINNNKLFVVGNATNMAPVTSSEKEKHNKSNSTAFICSATIPFDGFYANELALNYLFEIAALVYATKPEIKFRVVGGGDKPKPPSPNIEYTGYVADLREEILLADICLMPYPEKAVCGGARNKFCDYIALGKLVISSPEGMRGMKLLEHEKNCLVAKDKAEFAAIIGALNDFPQRIKRMEVEVEKIKDQYNWEDRGLQVSQIFEKIKGSNGLLS